MKSQLLRNIDLDETDTDLKENARRNERVLSSESINHPDSPITTTFELQLDKLATIDPTNSVAEEVTQTNDSDHDNEWKDVMWLAILYGDKKTILGLVTEYGISDRDGFTPLHMAICMASFINNSNRIIKMLTYHQYIDVNQHTKDDNETSLSLAVQTDNIDAVNILLANEATEINKPDNEGCTPFYIAARNGNLNIAMAILTKLLNKNMEFNIQAKDGTTPLDAARYNGHSNIVALLLSHLPNVQNKKDIADETLSNSERIQAERTAYIKEAILKTVAKDTASSSDNSQYQYKIEAIRDRAVNKRLIQKVLKEDFGIQDATVIDASRFYTKSFIIQITSNESIDMLTKTAKAPNIMGASK